MKTLNQPGTQSVKCPRPVRGKPCGRGTRVIRTKRLENGTVRRERVCTLGHTFATIEEPSDAS